MLVRMVVGLVAVLASRAGAQADQCVNAPLIGTGTFVGTTANATTDGDEPCLVDYSPDVWYRFIAPGRGTFRVDTCGSGYNTVLSVEGRRRAACLAHVRRKFFEALDTAPVEAQKALDLVLALYRVERVAEELGVLGTERHLELRATFARPAMANFLRFLRRERGVAPPRSPMGRAVNHALRNWL